MPYSTVSQSTLLETALLPVSKPCLYRLVSQTPRTYDTKQAVATQGEVDHGIHRATRRVTNMYMFKTPRQTDIHLRRDTTGAAVADVCHLRHHASSGFEWGYEGSGPADLALSSLAEFAPSADAEDRVMLADGAHCSRFAWKHHLAFRAEFVAALPQTGGVIRAANVHAWIAARRRTEA